MWDVVTFRVMLWVEVSKVFSGSFNHSVDEKNRVSIPAQFRRDLGARFVLTKGPDGCLWALPLEQWQIILAKAGQSTVIQRFFVASAVYCDSGPKGRCLLPDSLRKHADIKPGDEVAIVGMKNRIEIWSARRWEAVTSQLSTDRVRQEMPEFFDLS